MENIDEQQMWHENMTQEEHMKVDLFEYMETVDF